MKKILPLLFTVILSSAFILSCAQEKEKKEVKKEIRVNKENGNTTVTITESENGKTTERILTGEDAEKYLEENNGVESNEFHFSDDDEDGNHVVIVKEIDSENDGEHYVWVSEDGDDVHVSMQQAENELAEEMEELMEEFDELKKDEIKDRLADMMNDYEKMEKEMVVKLESIEEKDGEHGDVNVNVEEKDGVITIEKTVNGKTTVKTIKMDEEGNSGENIYIIKKQDDDQDDD